MTVHLYGTLARHIIRQILLPFLCCFFGFLFLFLIEELQNNLSDMLEHKNSLEVAMYFIYVLPERIPLILPMSLLLGTMYSFSNLNRHNEISAIRSSGISIAQMSLPAVVLSLFMSFVLFATNEYFRGYFDKEATRIITTAKGEEDQQQSVSFSVNSDDGKRIWNLTFESEGFSRISLAQYDPKGNPLWTVDAANGSFSDTEGWRFINGIRTSYSEKWFPSAPEKFTTLTIDNLEDDPQKMREFHNFNRHLTLSEISERLNSSIQFSPSETRIMNVKYYYMIFSPFACMLSILLGIPLSITQQRQGAMTSSAKAIGIMIAYYVVEQLFQNMGNAGHIPPIVAGSLPTLGFLTLGAFLCFKK